MYVVKNKKKALKGEIWNCYIRVGIITFFLYFSLSKVSTM